MRINAKPHRLGGGALVALLTAALCGGPAAAASAPVVPPPVSGHVVMENMYPQPKVNFAHGVVGLPNLTYSTIVGYRPLRLDLYLPPKAVEPGRHPLVIYIHGGGWLAGHSRQSGAFSDWPATLASLASRGYVVASLNYRLSSEAPFPAAEQDVKTAIRWLRAHASQYGIEKDKVIVWGASAGGHLAALTATSCGVKALEPSMAELGGRPTDSSHPKARTTIPKEAGESDCVQGAILWYGVFDFQAIAKQRQAQHLPKRPADGALSKFLNCGQGPCSEKVLRAASPITYVSSKSPPMQIVCGSDDSTVPPDQSREFYKRLKEAGVPASLTVIPGANHSLIGPTPAATRADSIKAYEMAVHFIDETTGHKAH